MKIIIIGVNGFLGNTVYKKMKPNNIVYGTSRNKSKNNTFASLNIEDNDTILNICKEINPDVVINCSAITDVAKCEIEKELAYSVHVKGIENLIYCCSQNNAKLIHFSSDYVFDGTKNPYSELSKPSPINYYGTTKNKADKLISDELSNFLILRTSILYGSNDSLKTDYVGEVLTQLKVFGEISADNVRIKYPVFIDNLSDIVNQLINENKNGLYNIATDKGYTRYEWAKLIANIFELDGNIKVTEEISYNSNRPKNVKLETKKIVNEGVKITDLVEGLKLIKKNTERINK
tara:strand:+ start:24399 stop:25271 length:873 start_codon:yes stop_codon:yes gene_type:complete